MSNEPTESAAGSRRWLVILGALVAIVAVLAVAFAVWFLRDDSPDEVSIDDAAAQVATTPEASDTSSPAASSDTTDDNASTDETATTDATDDTSSNDGDLSGTWNVDTSVGEFSYEDATGTFVGFRIAEELSGIGDTEAVGRTPDVSGSLDIDGDSITAVNVEADMTTITTNDSRRDDNVQSALDTDEFPSASFTLTEPIELPDAAMSGEAFAIDAVGDLTIHGVTESVTFPLEAQLVDATIVVVGSLDIVFADYGVEVPSAPVVISAADNGPIELQLFFTR